MSNRPLTHEQRRALWSRYHPAAATARATAGIGRPRQRPARVPFDRATVAVRITHPGGGCRTSAVYAHDLSTGGLSFLYPGFLHNGTAVSVALRKRAGGESVAHGYVAWCRHVGGLWHGVGVGFVTPVDPNQFVDPANPDGTEPDLTVATPHPSPLTEVKPHLPAVGGLTGRVLYLEDQELDQALLLHTVRRTKLNVATVDDVATAVSAVAAGRFDVVCVDLNLGSKQPTGERAMAQMRAAGYAGPFVVITDADDDRLDRARAAGEGGTVDTQFVDKPYAAGQLLAALTAALIRPTDAEDPMCESTLTIDAPPLYSQLAGQDGMAPLLSGFADRAHAAADDLERLLDTADHIERSGLADARPSASVRQLCQMLRGAGRGYGYPAVSAAADAALRAMEDGMNGLASADAEVRALQTLCRRVTA
jgi:CheY-like chemotaxis protein